MLRAIADSERKRWAPAENDAFRASATNLRAAALVAGVNRAVVDSYVRFAQIAHSVSYEKYEISGEAEEGSIPVSLGSLVTDAAQLLIEASWHPIRSSVRLKSELGLLHGREANLREIEHHDHIPWGLRSY